MKVTRPQPDSWDVAATSARIDSINPRRHDPRIVNHGARVRRKGGYRLTWARTSFAAAGSRLSLLAVLVALCAQTLAFGAHSGRSTDARDAAAALSQIVGSSVVLCVQSDGGTDESSLCHKSCPLCQTAGQTLALTAPLAPSEPAPPAPLSAEPRVVVADARPETEPIGLPFARGPPRSV